MIHMVKRWFKIGQRSRIRHMFGINLETAADQILHAIQRYRLFQVCFQVSKVENFVD